MLGYSPISSPHLTPGGMQVQNSVYLYEVDDRKFHKDPEEENKEHESQR